MRSVRLMHPALLILTLAVIYTFTIGGGGSYPDDAPQLAGGATEEERPTSTFADTSGTIAAPVEAHIGAVRGLDPAPGTEPTQQAAADSAANSEMIGTPDSPSPKPTARPEVAVASPEVAPAPAQLAEAAPVATSSADAASDEQDALAIGGPIEDEYELQQQRQPQIFVHVVQAGETLTDIARAYGVDVDTLLAANTIPNPNRIRVGEELDVLNVKGVLHEVQVGERLWDIARQYEVSMNEIVEVNNISNPDRIRVGERLVIPGAQALAALRRSEALVSASGQLLRNFSWPVTGRISSHFGMRWGRMHNGLDVAVVTGTPVRASAAGRVTFSGWNGGYGYLVIIDHGNQIETRYAHNSRLLVQAGDRVRRGDVIALSGNTGNSTGPHVHFEIRRNGQPLNPIDFLR